MFTNVIFGENSTYQWVRDPTDASTTQSIQYKANGVCIEHKQCGCNNTGHKDLDSCNEQDPLSDGIPAATALLTLHLQTSEWRSQGQIQFWTARYADDALFQYTGKCAPGKLRTNWSSSFTVICIYSANMQFVSIQHRHRLSIQIHFDPHLTGMFSQLSCNIILCDLLFNNGMYREVVNVFQRRREEQLKKGMSTSRHQNCLFFAACFKLVSDLHNSEHS